MKKIALSFALVLVAVVSALPASGGDDPVKEWDRVVGKAVDHLRAAQEGNGGWSTSRTPGVTGIVLTGLLQTGKVGANDPMCERGLKYVEGLVNLKEKHIAGKGDDVKVQLKNYVTCVNVMALVAAKREQKYRPLIGDAAQFLKQLQWDEGEGKNPKDAFFGGAGYDSQSRPDLSNTQMFLDALKAAGVPPSDPAYKKALIFISRCQNLKGETNDQPWAGKINDGSFIYTAADGGVTKVDDSLKGDDPRPGYGSMTYAGIKSLIYCGVSKNDLRVQKAIEWIRKNYSVDENPGMPTQRSKWGLYYYYHTMAKCLDALGIDYVEDAKGVKHNWRADLVKALAKRQRPDGSWASDSHWMEADPNLVTGYALMTLSYCRPRGK
jgi:squalene-hopene/tetraprenyl-beta-curcumene cyclase